ncbi:hypothetical protein BI330_13440 [Mycobacterium sp. CBMA 623]|nr:hypothetical protein [Mycobacteroides sp. CBMA 326]MUM17380.1 hypothetical protein [Mycobacteroides sp. CBMA 326]
MAAALAVLTGLVAPNAVADVVYVRCEFSVDRLIDLKPGSFMSSGTATSTIEGFEHPRFIDTKIATWGVNWGSLPKMS